MRHMRDFHCQETYFAPNQLMSNADSRGIRPEPRNYGRSMKNAANSSNYTLRTTTDARRGIGLAQSLEQLRDLRRATRSESRITVRDS